MVKVGVWGMDRIRIKATVGVIDCVYVVWCEESIVKKVLVLVLALLFNSSIGIGIGSTFCQNIGIVIGNTFTNIVNNPGKEFIRISNLWWHNLPQEWLHSHMI